MKTGASVGPSSSRSSCGADSPVVATSSSVGGSTPGDAVAVEGASSSSDVDATSHWPRRPALRASGASPPDLANPRKALGLAYSSSATVANRGSEVPTTWRSTAPTQIMREPIAFCAVVTPLA